MSARVPVYVTVLCKVEQVIEVDAVTLQEAMDEVRDGHPDCEVVSATFDMPPVESV